MKAFIPFFSYRRIWLKSTVLLLLFSALSFAVEMHYDSSSADFPNPERGFFIQRSTSDGPLSESELRNYRQNQHITLVRMLFKIPVYTDSIPAWFLNRVEQDFNTARNAGVKLIPRFRYVDDMQDAPLQWVQIHIDQLAPLLQQHADVIAFLEAGFIGAWGEWHSSTNNLDNPDSMRVVLFKLLDVLPETRTVAIRTPHYKMDIFGTDQPISENEAFNGSRRSRTAHHNDCFLADATDMGTYLNISLEKAFLEQETKYLPIGGETCQTSSYTACSNALNEMARFHWSALNLDYHPGVIQQWKNEGCFEEIKRRLGYRLRLVYAATADSVRPGGSFQLNLQLRNDGWANPYNPRNLEVILRKVTTGEVYRLLTGLDPRYWQAGDTIRLNLEGGIPDDMPQGEYEVCIHLSDPEINLHDHPEYAIRLANPNVWEDNTGYNNLQFTIHVDTAASGENYQGSNFFTNRPYQSDVFQIDFNADVREGAVPLTVNFSDLTIVPQGDSIVLREWDFNNDGTVDATDANPTWVYDVPGDYDVRLRITTTDTVAELVRPKYIHVYDTAGVSIAIDGDFYDWQTVPMLDNQVAEDSGDALNDNVDILDTWVASDGDNLYVSYRMKGRIQFNNYFYHVFIDVDEDSATGFHSADSQGGFDYMVENGNLWRYSGTQGEWSWQNAGSIAYQIGNTEDSRLELAIPLQKLGITQSRRIGLVFNVNDVNDNHPDDYAPDSYQSGSYVYTVTITAISKKEEAVYPKQWVLTAYPNPFNHRVIVHFNWLPREGDRAAVYDVQGRKVRDIPLTRCHCGTVTWDGVDDAGRPLSSGIYFFRYQGQTVNRSIKLFLVR